MTGFWRDAKMRKKPQLHSKTLIILYMKRFRRRIIISTKLIITVSNSGLNDLPVQFLGTLWVLSGQIQTIQEPNRKI